MELMTHVQPPMPVYVLLIPGKDATTKAQKAQKFLCLLCFLWFLPVSLTAAPLFDDRKLGRLHIEWLPFAGAALRVFRCDGVAHDAERCVSGHHPFEHPELSFRLLSGLTVAHRKVKGLACVVQVDDELGRAISLPCRGIDCGHAKSNRIASLISVVQRAVERLAWAEEVG